jgi:hypothetical protein
MKYTVEWTSPAEDELIDIWTSATDQGLMTAVVHRLEQRLQINPYVGKTRHSSVNRVVLSLPIGIWFDIIEDDKRFSSSRSGQLGENYVEE